MDLVLKACAVFLTWPFVAIGRISLCQPVPLSVDGTSQGWTWLSMIVAV